MSSTQNAARISLVVSFFVLALKFIAYYQTTSAAILSDALETIANVVTAIVALVILKQALAPADADHPYGHGKLEYFSASFEGGIILFAALAIIFESCKALIIHNTVENISVGLFYIGIASVINLIAGLYLRSIGKKQNSEALKASGAHLLSDVKTTAGIAVGLFLYKVTGFAWIDPAMGILVGLWLVYESVQIIKNNIGGLLDQTDVASVEQLSEKIEKHLAPEIIDIHALRIIRSGSFHHIDAHLVVPQFLEIHYVHELIHTFEKKVVQDYKFDGEFAFHTDPCYQKYCSACEVKKCPLRKSEFIARITLTPKHLMAGPQYTEKN